VKWGRGGNYLASLDADLQQVVAEWGSLTAYVRGAIMAILVSEKPNVQCDAGFERSLLSENVQR
jgi:hypothetical protein